MHAIRQLYEDAPTSISIPEFMRHKRLEVILLIQESPEIDANPDLKALLAAMPIVGDDEDFSRQRDFGRGDVAWDS